MKNTTHRVVILKNVNSDMISQAILILKDSAMENDSNLIMEAERIVERYMNKVPVISQSKNNTKLTAWILSVGIALMGIGIFAVLKLI